MYYILMKFISPLITRISIKQVLWILGDTTSEYLSKLSHQNNSYQRKLFMAQYEQTAIQLISLSVNFMLKKEYKKEPEWPYLFKN